MSKQEGSPVSTPPTTPNAPISTLLTNLRLLDLEKRDDWPEISIQVFTGKDDPQTQKTRIQCVEWICYRLYQIWDREGCQKKLQPFFPALEPLQSINLRIALFKCMNELKRDGILGRDVNIRKSMFDDCKGETLQKTLSAFSTIVLRKVLALDVTCKNSIAHRLCLAEKVPSKENFSLLPLAIAHRMSLITLLRKKRTLRARYRDFGNALENKDSDLTSKFDMIVGTQDFLDKNPPSESTVQRVSIVLDQYWQGDRRLVDVIAQGEEQELRDALLDQEFRNVWPKVSTGRFDGDISTSQHGLLEDLEKRVAEQQARLEYWKDFKNDLEKKNLPKHGNLPVSPARHAFGSPTSHRHQQFNEKDLVFSSRKSPRKSMWPAGSLIGPTTNEASNYQRPTTIANTSNDLVSWSPLAAKSKQHSKSASKDMFSNESFSGENDESCFSEAPTGCHDVQRKEHPSSPSKKRSCSVGDGKEEVGPQRHWGNTASRIESDDIKSDNIAEDAMIFASHPNSGDGMPPPTTDDDNKLLVELLSGITNAAPTHFTSKLSLFERTRQSVAFVSSDLSLGDVGTCPPNSGPLIQEEAPPVRGDAKATLAERTRQSISLVPAKPKRPRDPMHARRTSKLYPTNQFETPRRKTMVQKTTPPEELMNPGAGYDSVFKSRPKVAFSPTASLVADSENGGELEEGNN